MQKEDVENFGENEEISADALTMLEAATATEADSSWLVRTEMVPISSPESEQSGDTTAAEETPGASPVPSGFDACLAVSLILSTHACTLLLS